MLLGWFALNQRDPSAHEYLYVDIPYHYVWTAVREEIPGQDKPNIFYMWKRSDREVKCVSRLYMVQPNNRELFCLRLLPLHVKGATSFEYLRTHGNTVYPTFYDAAFGRGLLESDNAWDTILKETSVISTAKQLRELFIVIIVYNTPSNPFELWQKYKSFMIEDYAHRYQNGADSDYYHLALAEIHAGLAAHAVDSSFLPQPDSGIVDRFASLSNAERLTKLAKQYQKDGRLMMHQLNEDQKKIFNQIISAARRVRLESDYTLNMWMLIPSTDLQLIIVSQTMKPRSMMTRPITVILFTSSMVQEVLERLSYIIVLLIICWQRNWRCYLLLIQVLLLRCC